jgi:hypothetical protein
MAAGCEDPLDEGEVADASMGRQMVEAARVVDQVVRAAKLGRGERKGVAVVEPDVRPSLPGPLLGPVKGGLGEVDGVHLKTPRGQVERVASGAAAQVEGTARGDQAPVEIPGEAFVRLRHEERHGPGAVGIEAVPPVGSGGGPAVGLRREQAVQKPQYIVDGTYGPVHPYSPLTMPEG